MIPRRLHYVWVGGPLPPKQQAFIDSWRATNPDFEIVEWNESNIDMSQPLIKAAHANRQWSKIADIARLFAVLQQGGIYLDTDFRVLKPLDPLLSHKCFYGFQFDYPHPTDWIANGAFGAEPGHWFIGRALDAILRMPVRRWGWERPTSFGPKLITRLLREAGLKDDMYSRQGAQVRDIFLTPTQVFYPFKYGEEFTNECVQPDTLAAHFWEKSWDKDLPALVRAARSLRNKIRNVVA